MVAFCPRISIFVQESAVLSTKMPDLVDRTSRNGILSTKKLDLVDRPSRNGILSMKKPDLVDRPSRNGILSTEKPDFVDRLLLYDVRPFVGWFNIRFDYEVVALSRRSSP